MKEKQVHKTEVSMKGNGESMEFLWQTQHTLKLGDDEMFGIRCQFDVSQTKNSRTVL